METANNWNGSIIIKINIKNKYIIKENICRLLEKWRIKYIIPDAIRLSVARVKVILEFMNDIEKRGKGQDTVYAISKKRCSQYMQT